jgi:hypothetical protein
MQPGNHIEHLAHEALEKGRAEDMWIGLRNTYFREGTQEEGFSDMVKCFAELGVKATSDWRELPAGRKQFIVLTPIPKD